MGNYTGYIPRYNVSQTDFFKHATSPSKVNKNNGFSKFVCGPLLYYMKVELGIQMAYTINIAVVFFLVILITLRLSKC